MTAHAPRGNTAVRLDLTTGARVAARGFTAAAALAALLLAAPVAWASPGAKPTAHGGKAIGRAGADTAVADDATSTVRNPALLMERYSLRADLAIGFLYARTRFRNERNDYLGAGLATPVPSLGLAWDPIGVAPGASDAAYFRGSNVRLGFNLFVPVGGGGETKLRNEVFPDGQTEEQSFFVLAAAPSLAFRLTDRLSFGVQPQLLMLSLESEGLVGESDGQSQGIVRFHRDGEGNPLPEPEPWEPDGDPITWGELFEIVSADTGTGRSDASVRNEIDSVFGLGYGATFGLAWRPRDDLNLGLSYQIEGRIPRATGRARINANAALGSFDEDLEAIFQEVLATFLPNGGQQGFTSRYDFEVRDFKTPAVLSAGLAYTPHPRWLVAADLRYIFWRSAFNSFDVKLTDGANADLNEINGQDFIEDENELKWKDTFLVALGCAALVHERVVLRAGYSYHTNPVRRSYASPTSAITEHTLSIGGSVFLGGWDLDAAIMYAVPNTMAVDESRSLAEYDRSSHRSDQLWLYLSAGYQF